MITVFADSFYYFALLNPDDPAHEAARSISTSLRTPVVTTAWILAEVADGLATANKRSGFTTLYNRMKSNPRVIIVQPTWELFEAGTQFYADHRDKDWTLTDCISFIVMRRAEIADALTGDHHFEQAGFRALLK